MGDRSAADWQAGRGRTMLLVRPCPAGGARFLNEETAHGPNDPPTAQVQPAG